MPGFFDSPLQKSTKQKRAKRDSLNRIRIEQAAAAEQELPPPPDFLYDPDAVGQATPAQRSNELGLIGSGLASESERLLTAEEIQAREAEAFALSRAEYEEAYQAAGAESPEERGAVLAARDDQSRMIKYLIWGVVLYVVVRSI